MASINNQVLARGLHHARHNISNMISPQGYAYAGSNSVTGVAHDSGLDPSGGPAKVVESVSGPLDLLLWQSFIGRWSKWYEGGGSWMHTSLCLRSL